jgi:ketosteroid isomerase-like protein
LADDSVAAVEAALRAHDRAFSALDFDAVAAMWDDADDRAAYVAEEYATPQVGWTELNKHWARLGARLQRAELATDPASVRLIADDLALVIALQGWRYVTVDSEAERTGRSWCTILLRRRADGWRLFHSMEAPIFLAE